MDFNGGNGGNGGPGGGASLSDLATNGKLLNQNISLLIQTLKTVFPQVSSIAGGSFTCGAAATTTVTETATAANSYIILIPTNAAAGTLMGSTKSLYISARTANTSFAVSTASGAAAAGTEQFLYLAIAL